MQLSKIMPMEYVHDERYYQLAHEILEFVMAHSLPQRDKLTDEIILAIGKTGWGKSTTINLLEGIQFKKTEGSTLIPVNLADLKTEIGTGEGSTTLFPVYV